MGPFSENHQKIWMTWDLAAHEFRKSYPCKSKGVQGGHLFDYVVWCVLVEHPFVVRAIADLPICVSSLAARIAMHTRTFEFLSFNDDRNM